MMMLQFYIDVQDGEKPINELFQASFFSNLRHVISQLYGFDHFPKEHK